MFDNDGDRRERRADIHNFLLIASMNEGHLAAVLIVIIGVALLVWWVNATE